MRPTAAIGRWFGGAGRILGRVARRAAHLRPGQYLGFSLISPVLSGKIVTPQSALTLTAVYAAINTIATDSARLPLITYQARKEGGKRPATADPRYRLLAIAPNPEMSAFRYFQSAMSHVLGWGNHYSEIIRDGSGMPTALWPMDPGKIEPRRDERTRALFYADKETGRRFLPEQVLHIAGLGFDGILGYSPVTLARQAIGLGIAAEEFGAAFYGNGAMPGGVLETPKKISAEASRRIRETWENVHGGTLNAHRTAILEEGLTWKSTQIPPEDAQFLTTRQFQVVEICRLFNLPPSKLQDYQHAHLANLEESNLDYLGSTLMGWLTAIESEVNRKLFFADEAGRVFAGHEMSALMRGNMAARVQFYTGLFGMGAICPDEIRDKEGLNPIGPDGGGDQFLVQAQYVPLEQAGRAMAAKAGAGTGTGTPPVDETPDDIPDPGSQIANNSARPPGTRRHRGPESDHNPPDEIPPIAPSAGE